MTDKGSLCFHRLHCHPSLRVKHKSHLHSLVFSTIGLCVFVLYDAKSSAVHQGSLCFLMLFSNWPLFFLHSAGTTVEGRVETVASIIIPAANAEVAMAATSNPTLWRHMFRLWPTLLQSKHFILPVLRYHVWFWRKTPEVRNINWFVYWETVHV